MTTKPNILLIMLDQWRFDWLDKCITPAIHSLAKSGTQFTQAVCNSPACVPSRASLSSGRYPHRIGVLSNEQLFPLEQPTVYQQLRKGGYRVGGFGKLEFQKPLLHDENRTTMRNEHFGFTDFVETEGKMSSGKTRSDGQLMGRYQRWLEQKQLLKTHIRDYKQRVTKPKWHTLFSSLAANDRLDYFIARQAKDYLLSTKADTPWFCGVYFSSPHNPWDAVHEHYERFSEMMFAPPIPAHPEQKPAWIRARQHEHTAGMPASALGEVKRHYAALLWQVDSLVATLVNTLAEIDATEQTVIIITSDHGEMLGDHRLFNKQAMYESSIRIPLLIIDPLCQQTATTSALVEMVDLFPTILDFAQIHFDDTLDGQSLKPLLTNPKAHLKAEQLAVLENCNMLRTNEYKYICHSNNRDELYHLLDDPFETKNVAESMPDIAKMMNTRLKRKKGGY